MIFSETVFLPQKSWWQAIVAGRDQQLIDFKLSPSPFRESLSKKLGEKDDNSETDNKYLFWQEMSVGRVETE